MNPLSDESWPLARYAYFEPDSPDTPNKGSWQFHDADEEIRFVITSTCNLLIMAATKILENHSLITQNDAVKAVSKGDSLLIFSRVKNDNRRFRVKFLSGSSDGVTSCQEAVTSLRRFISVRPLDKETDKKTSQNTPASKDGDISLAMLAKVALAEEKTSLPLVYAEIPPLAGGDISTLVRLCLSDVSFPALVGQVERELKTMAQEQEL